MNIRFGRLGDRKERKVCKLEIDQGEIQGKTVRQIVNYISPKVSYREDDTDANQVS